MSLWFSQMRIQTPQYSWVFFRPFEITGILAQFLRPPKTFALLTKAFRYPSYNMWLFCTYLYSYPLITSCILLIKFQMRKIKTFISEKSVSSIFQLLDMEKTEDETCMEDNFWQIMLINVDFNLPSHLTGSWKRFQVCKLHESRDQKSMVKSYDWSSSQERAT